ncbi:Ribokinase-like protein [Aspergillus keveii]|uniref:Ribokinase n=1 Tax=Aspergillus keveii TaxID=714993 RepID=A0ABR4GJN8_9EURO
MPCIQPQPKPRILIIGSLNIDIVTTTPRIPHPGETITATSRTLSPGGKGANQAVACGRAAFVSPTKQDVSVSIVGAVGGKDGYFASLIEPILRTSGVETEGVSVVEGGDEAIPTGTSLILVDAESAENRILFVPGANYVGMRDVEWILHRSLAGNESKGAPDVVVLQGEILHATTIALLEFFNAETVKTHVVFNPAPMPPQGIPPTTLRGLAVLVMNETECLLLAQSLGLVPEVTGISGFQFDTIASHLLNLGTKNIIVTLGGDGAYFASETGRGHVPAVTVDRVVDTTAAGDTFTGYVAVALARVLTSAGPECEGGCVRDSLGEFDLRAAVEGASVAAAKCVQVAGSMGSIPFGYEL